MGVSFIGGGRAYERGVHVAGTSVRVREANSRRAHESLKGTIVLTKRFILIFHFLENFQLFLVYLEK